VTIDQNNSNYRLSIIVPTFNEKGNILELVKRLKATLKNESWEVIFVDDGSTDGTVDKLSEASKSNSNVKFIRRIRERCLSTACIEGMLSSTSEFVAVMDADLQHDETALLRMLEELTKGNDLAIGSRFNAGGSTGDLAKNRVDISKLATKLGSLIIHHKVLDPMSGFFMLNRKLLDSIYLNLTASGYKLLLDIILNAPASTKILEIPYEMRSRTSGQSKLDTHVILDYLYFIIDKTAGRFIPTQFVIFCLVGLTGVFIHLAALSFQIQVMNTSFNSSQIIATFIAMSSNFVINNQVTYRENRLTGLSLYTGLVTFYMACSLGALLNLMVSKQLLSLTIFNWFTAGAVGAIIGSIWNYSMTKVFTWRKKN